MLGKHHESVHYKKRQTVELKDYRPVSILPNLSIVYKKLALQELAVFIKRESVYHQCQSGYRKNHSIQQYY